MEAGVLKIWNQLNLKKNYMSKPLFATCKIKKVTKANFIGFGWEKDQVNIDPLDPTGKKTITTANTNYVDLVCGPKNHTEPHIKLGSVLLTLPKTIEPTLRRIRLRNNEHSGTRLSDLNELMYSTYIDNNINNSSPALALQIDIDNDQVAEFNIFFDPTIQHAQNNMSAEVQKNVWQKWDACNGLWQYLGTPPPELPNKFFTLQTLVNIPKFNSARIINTVAGQNAGGGIRFTIGGDSPDYKDFKGYVDAFLIHTADQAKPIVYDFVCEKLHGDDN